MAKGKGEIKGWITKNGVHIPIYGHYSIRGGEEPQAKGSRWGKGKKNPDKYTNPRTGKRDHVQGKTQADLNKALKEQGLELDGAYQRAENEEKVYMYDKDGNVYSGTFNKYSDGGREIVNIERDKLNGESNVRNLDPDRDEHIKNGESKGARREEAIKKQENERFKTAKELKAEGKWDTSETDQGKTIEVNGKKINVKPGENNSQAIYRQAMEEQGKPVDKQFYDSQRADYNPDAPSSKPKAGQESSAPTEPYAKSNNKYLGQSVKDLNKLDVRNLNDSELSQLREHASASSRTGARGADKLWKNVDAEINRRAMEQESSTPDFSKMSYSEAGQYVADHKKDFGLSEGADAYQAAYEMKKGTWKGKMPGQESSKATPESYAQSKGKSIRDIAQEVNNNDAARAQANQLMKDGRTYEEAAALAHSDMERGTLKGQESSTPDFSKMSYSEAGKYVAANKAQYGLKDSDDAYLAAAQMKDGNWKGQQTVQENRDWAARKNRETMIDSPESSASNLHSRIQAQAEQADVHRQRTSVKKASVPESYKKQESSTPNPYAEGSTYSVKLRGEKRVNGTYAGSEPGNDMIGTWHKFHGEDGKLYYVSSKDIEKGTSKVTTPRARKTQTTSSAVDTDNRMGTYRKEAQRRYGTDWNSLSNTRKGMIAQDVEEASVKKANTGAIPNTVSGLRSAYANATGSEKAKISAELRRKGYTLVGGKWVKGKKE